MHREHGRRIRCKGTISPEKQVTQMARAAPVLVSKLQRTSHGRLGEKLPANCSCCRSREEHEHTRGGARESDITVWEDRERYFHHGLSLPNLRIPSVCHLFKQLRHEACLRMKSYSLFAVCCVFDECCTYFSFVEQKKKSDMFSFNFIYLKLFN